METYQIIISLQSAFATLLKGDTLFGQLCWAIRNRFGENQLHQALDGYVNNQPFAVVSDAFPENYLPLPKLPSNYFILPEGEDHKSLKKRTFLPENDFQKPVQEWLQHAVNPKSIINTLTEQQNSLIHFNSLSEFHPQAHNTINRQTNTTGPTGFAPYSVEQEWFIPGLRWTIYLLLDTTRVNVADCRQCLTDIGSFGYGKDASIGMGKFKIDDFQTIQLPAQPDANASLTLSPCAPQGLDFDDKHSYYQIFTRFGRHGDMAAQQDGKPFKNPILLANTAGVFGVAPPQSGFIGQGIGGNAQLSKTLPTTVHQGYAPVMGIKLNPKESL